MAAPGMHQDEGQLLASLALAMVERPRSTLTEIARSVGISKATLYRYCRTRDELVTRLTLHSTTLLTRVIHSAKLQTAPVLEALRELNAGYMEHRELIAFLVYFRREKEAARDPGVESEWERSLDTFFLRGQREGIFRIDITAQGLTEIWAATMIGLVDAERRGRIARAGLMAILENAFLQGVSAN